MTDEEQTNAAAVAATASTANVEEGKPAAEVTAEAAAPEAPAPEALRTDGPTLAEFIAAGYKEEDYPPAGYAVKEASRPTGNKNTPVVDEFGNKRWE